jgi:capsular exopolysaccharide synthesis family protein
MSKFYEATSRIDPALAEDSVTAVPPRAAAPAATTPAVRQASAAAAGVERAKDSRELLPIGETRTANVRPAAGSPILPFDGADETAAERYRVIRTRLRQDSRSPRLLCISSPGTGDGKSVNAINIAGVLALKRENVVLLVDSDLRRFRLAGMLGLEPGPGLSEVLASEIDWRDAIVRVVEAPNLYVLTAGEQKSNPAELLDSARWKRTCESLRQHFSHVVIDSPPMGTVADYDLIQSVCDGVIVVARQDHSNRARLLKCLESVQPDRLIGVLMNHVSPWTLWRAGDSHNQYGYGPATK